MTGKKIFITVGTTKFDKLYRTILQPESLELFQSLGYSALTIQIGNSQHTSEDDRDYGIPAKIYRFKDSISDDIRNSDLVISHAGAGTCLEVLDIGKPLLVVINTDLMNNHQTEIAEQLQIDGHLYHCTCDTLRSTLKNADFSLLKPYPKADATPLFEHLDKLLGFV
ncbi:alg13 UDP-N-acetylglucosaminyltransferase subunit [Arctopsyche grandis]|uniref:alg13 UDP-N-acetylglucosaminyltransferase subunit n=1 Tax=Arctopsyche grandis TaxID=121162 RepID=UPI00406D8634